LRRDFFACFSPLRRLPLNAGSHDHVPTTSYAKAFHADVVAIAPGDVIPESMIISTSTHAGFWVASVLSWYNRQP
jgi:hypothetical protein